jgi:hypothetical protein
MNGSQPAPVAPAGDNAPAEVDLTRIQAERDTSQRDTSHVDKNQSTVKSNRKPRRRRIRRSAVASVRGVTAPDLPEGI